MDLLKQLDILEIVNTKRKTSSDDTIQAELNTQFVRIKGGPDALRYMFTRNMPTIKYGSEYSGILSANVSTNSDPKMQVIHMQRSQKKGDTPVGEVDDGLPMTIFPISLSLEAYGCPLLHVNQQFFVDFQTNTSIDDIYVISGVSHSLSPGEFKSNIKMTPLNKTGQFKSMQQSFETAKALSAATAKDQG